MQIITVYGSIIPLTIVDEVASVMHKVLIADSAEELSQALLEKLNNDFQVLVCHNGIRALDMIRTLHPDILVINMALAGMDGLMILDIMHALGLHPVAIALLNSMDSYIQSCLASRGVVYTYLQPCSVRSVVARIEELGRHLSGAEPQKATGALEHTLRILGVRSKLTGYVCIQAAVQQLLRDPEQSLTKEVYPAVAAICGGTPARVEKAIRSTILDSWKRREDEIWKVFFPPDHNGKLLCPSNGDFLSTVVACLLRGNL